MWGGEGVLYGKSLSLNFAVNPNKVALKSLFKKGGGTPENTWNHLVYYISG